MFGLIKLFRSAEPDPLPALSIIGDDTTIRGDPITGTGDLRVEGTIYADVVREGRVTVAPDGAVHGTVRTQSIRVAGTVWGELYAEETLVTFSEVEAHLQTDALTIESGAAFKGVVHDEAGLPPSVTSSPSGDHLPSPVASVTLGPPPEPDPDAFVSVWDEEGPGRPRIQVSLPDPFGQAVGVSALRFCRTLLDPFCERHKSSSEGFWRLPRLVVPPSPPVLGVGHDRMGLPFQQPKLIYKDEIHGVTDPCDGT